MKLLAVPVMSLSLLLVAVTAQADSTISSVQQTLKDQGFYYGEITGQKDADTTAAIRRYQIRNGLQVTGELNAETSRSLGVKGHTEQPPRPTAAPRATPAPTATPPAPFATPSPDTSDLMEEGAPGAQTPPSVPQDEPPTAYAPGPRGLAPATSGVFNGTPYEVAPPELQRRVIMGAQTLLARRGYYRDVVDGEYGPGTEFALRAFQSRFGIAPSGRLDMDTLAALGLLPGQRAPGVTARPRGRPSYRQPRVYTPQGEPIYDPRWR